MSGKPEWSDANKEIKIRVGEIYVETKMTCKVRDEQILDSEDKKNC